MWICWKRSCRRRSDPTMTDRHFTVAVFVVDAGRVLLLHHRALRRWLPPGGHIEAGELPDDAARREVREETGLIIDLPPARQSIVPGGPRSLPQPAGLQLERIGPGHEHIDLVYFAVPAPGSPKLPRANEESTRVGWYAPTDWDDLGVDAEIRAWANEALRWAAGRSRFRRQSSPRRWAPRG